MHLSFISLSSCSFWFYFTVCEWLHARSGSIPSHLFTTTLALLAWQRVSNSMPGAASSHFFTSALVLLAWQQVSSDFMPGVAIFLLIVLTVTALVLWLDSKWVVHKARSSCSHCHFAPIGLTASEWFQPYPFPLSSLSLWTCWLYRLWVIPWQVQLYLFSLSPLLPPGPVGFIASECFWPGPARMYLFIVLTATVVLLAWQDVGGSMSLSLAVSLLTIPHCYHSGPAIGLTACEWFHAIWQLCPFNTLSSLISLAWQLVSDSMSGSAVILLTIPVLTATLDLLA